MVRNSVEETLNGLLNEEAHSMSAQRIGKAAVQAIMSENC